MRTMNIESQLQSILNRSLNRRVPGIVVSIESGDGEFSWTGTAGAVSADQQYFIASTTKLYTTAVILHLQAKQKLDLDSSIADFLSPEQMRYIPGYREPHDSSTITVRHLLSHTSGLPDYFRDNHYHGPTCQTKLLQGHDSSLDFDSFLEMIVMMNPKFHPGTPRRAYYSDSNYQILGHIAECSSEKSLSELYEEIVITPLGLSRTYLYTDPTDQRPLPLNYKDAPLLIPKAMASFGPDGGIVSTSRDSIRFLKGFFSGEIFPEQFFTEMKNWNRIFFPLQYGMGIARFKLPWFFSPFQRVPELIGHSGLSGAWAFYAPEKDLYVAGTVNQIANPGRPFQLMCRLISCF